MRALEHKIPPPIITLLTAAAMWGIARLSPVIETGGPIRLAVAAALAAVGLLFAAPAVLAFRRARTTINPVDINAASALVTGGIFGVTRNPMYAGMLFVLLGWMVFLAAPWGVFGPVGFMLFITRFQIMPEERVMAGKFGTQYAEYRQRTRRWL